MSKPQPTAAAMGSVTRQTSLAPARLAASITALFSTVVIPDGTQIIAGSKTPAGNFADKMLEDFFGDLEIRNNPFIQRDGPDISGGANISRAS